jgi:menaquinone-specific isochorismate synthase
MKFSSGELQKAVPYIFESTPHTMTRPQLLLSLKCLLNYIIKYPAYVYGFWGGSKGILGATPEILFRLKEKNLLETIACAGTAKPEDVETMLSTKNRHEHQLVVDGLTTSLTPYGKMQIHPIVPLALPGITHLTTPISIALNSKPDFIHLVETLHPTPALGAYPRHAGMKWLRTYARKIRRLRFGAPAGYFNPTSEENCCCVSIRNVQWDAQQMRIGAGCGVVQASCARAEWEEICLKLFATKEMLCL